MRRREAIQVYKEICQCIPDASFSNISLVSIDFNDFGLRIGIYLNSDNFRKIKSIIKAHDLAMKQNQRGLLIYRREVKTIGMEIIV